MMTSKKGDVIERIVRTKIGISELSRILNVSRTSIYNWFQNGHLNFETICKIGMAIGHDFSNEFPEEFAKAQNHISENLYSEKNIKHSGDESSILYWMNKYIELLEKYNELLVDIAIPDTKIHFKNTDTIHANKHNPDTTRRIDRRDHSLSYI